MIATNTLLMAVPCFSLNNDRNEYAVYVFMNATGTRQNKVRVLCVFHELRWEMTDQSVLLMLCVCFPLDPDSHAYAVYAFSITCIDKRQTRSCFVCDCSVSFKHDRQAYVVGGISMMCFKHCQNRVCCWCCVCAGHHGSAPLRWQSIWNGSTSYSFRLIASFVIQSK